jgi:hypothetical protein
VFLYAITPTMIAEGLINAQNSALNVQLMVAAGQSFWVLTSGELQLHSDAGGYDFIFSPYTCIV